MRFLATLFLTLTFFCSTAYSQDHESRLDEMLQALERFRLWNDCETVWLLVGGLPNHAEDIGLIKDDIEVAVRSRLRSAKLYKQGSKSFLYVYINMTEIAFSVSIEFFKTLKDERLEFSTHAMSWNSGTVGTHGKDPLFISNAVALYTDRFIDEYLRVNPDACK